MKGLIKQYSEAIEVKIGQVVAVLNDKIYIRGKVVHIVEDIDHNIEKNVYEVRDIDFIPMNYFSLLSITFEYFGILSVLGTFVGR